jgi:hypothetical protein
MGWLRRDRANQDDAPRGEELYRQVHRIVDEEVGELVQEGRVRLESKADDDDPDWPSWELRLTPHRAGATAISMTIYDDTVTFGVGEADAWDELWSINSGWETLLRGMVCAVRDGRYSENVRSGVLLPLKVTMRFGGVRRKGRTDDRDYTIEYGSMLSSVGGDLPMPATGEFEYAA